MSRTSHAKLRTVDMRVLDKVFGMERGYVLDFSNRTFAEFFREELQVDIDSEMGRKHTLARSTGPPLT